MLARWVGLGLVLLVLQAASGRAEQRVDVELFLAVDVSGSMDSIEHRLQRGGYVAAIKHPEVIRAITGGAYGRIALTYVEWAGTYSHAVKVPWTLVESAAGASAFADRLAATPISVMSGTSISGIIDEAIRSFETNGFEGLKIVLDISGDGANNLGPPVETARDRGLAAGIVINGLPIMLRPGPSGMERYDLAAYFEACVVGGPGAFVVPVHDRDDLETAIRRKLVWDIAGREAQLWRAQVRDEPAPAVDCFIGEKLRRLWHDP